MLFPTGMSLAKEEPDALSCGARMNLSSRICPRWRIRIADEEMGRGGQSVREESLTNVSIIASITSLQAQL